MTDLKMFFFLNLEQYFPQRDHQKHSYSIHVSFLINTMTGLKISYGESLFFISSSLNEKSPD